MSSTSIQDAFELPSAEDIRALGFVIQLNEIRPGSREESELVGNYVVTPAVEQALPRIFGDMKQVFDRGEDYGRFIHGSFGSGKSHFMTQLALLIENSPAAWEKFGPLLQAHRDDQKAKGREVIDPQSWLPAANLLVVRLHMLSRRGHQSSFDRTVYEAFNTALEKRGKEPFEFVDVEGLFDEVRREADEYGDLVWKNLEDAEIVGGREDFEALARGSARGRERFARAWLDYKGRSAHQAGIDPRWSEGLKRMGEHAKSQGFGGIVLMIDEFMLWLGEKEKEAFVREINDLNLIVDHNTGQRPAPIFVFVAQQRDLREFFPDLVDESEIHERIEHHANRFEITRLEDVELRHIVKGRVLRPRDPDLIRRVVDSIAERHGKVLQALASNADLGYLEDVYPFHPALIEMLVDVTSLMQRERSALRLLYELLVIHYPHLPLGEFLPVGSAFDAIFPKSGVEASKKTERMQDIHHQYHVRLAPEMAKLGLDAERLTALDQLVKTVLLAEVSPRLKQSGLTIERLVQLNAVDVEGETFRGRISVAETDLLALAQKVPDLQVAGKRKTAIVRYVLGQVSLTGVLARARAKTGGEAQRFAVFWPSLKKALGVDSLRGFAPGDANEGDWELRWRRTRRRGSLKLGNVRNMTYDDFEPPVGAFKILVDYPWDDPGHTVGEDRLRAENVRKKKGTRFTACWLPRHLTPSEIDVLTELAAVRHVLSEPGQDDLLDTLGPHDKVKVLEQARVRESSLRGQLDDLVAEVYVRAGEWVTLISDVDTSRPRETLAENLEHMAVLLMDRQFPQHPNFAIEPKRAELELLLDWMVEASETNMSVRYDDRTRKALESLGQPLEIVNLGRTKAALRFDSRYLKDVLRKTDGESVSWQPVAEYLGETYGLQPLLVSLFLCFLCRRDHRALHETTGEVIEVELGSRAVLPIRLQRGTTVQPAEWSRLRELGHQLFGLARPSTHRSLRGQDQFVLELRSDAQPRREALQSLHQALVTLGVDSGDRLREVAEANARLAPLQRHETDSYQVLTELLAQWPDDTGDPIRRVVHQATVLRDDLSRLDEHAREQLRAGVEHPQVGPDVIGHLAQLDRHLAAAQAQKPIEKAWVERWNQQARALALRLIEQPNVVSDPGGVEPTQGTGATASPVAVAPFSQQPGPSKGGSGGVGGLLNHSRTLWTGEVDPSRGRELDLIVRELRQTLEALGPGAVRLALVRQDVSKAGGPEENGE